MLAEHGNTQLLLYMVVQTTQEWRKLLNISQKFITAWFDNKCVAMPCGTAKEHSAMHLISTYNVVEKPRK